MESQTSNQKKKGFCHKLKRKSGGIIIIIYQAICLALFLTFEAQTYLKSPQFPHLLLPLIPTLLFFLNLTLLLFCTIMDPGVQPQRSTEHQQASSLYYNTHRRGPTPVIRPMIYFGHHILGNYCFTCRHFKHPRTIHCDYCNRCIVRYDHHCTILDCCIGIRNFAVYFYLLVFLFLFHFYVTVVSLQIFLQLIYLKQYPSILNRVTILWITLISLLISCFLDACHLLLFPCVYLFVSAHGKTAKELFFVVETHGHHCKCYKVIKSIQGFNGSTNVTCTKMLSNLRKYLCSAAPPSLLKPKNYYLVCPVDELKNEPLLVKMTRSKSEGDLVYLYKQELLAYKFAETRKISCCAL